jgi:hypothetical protein
VVESLLALRALRPELARRGVTHFWLFGSRARQTVQAGSDWDLLVEFDHAPDLVGYRDLKYWSARVRSRMSCGKDPKLLRCIPTAGPPGCVSTNSGSGEMPNRR